MIESVSIKTKKHLKKVTKKSDKGASGDVVLLPQNVGHTISDWN